MKTSPSSRSSMIGWCEKVLLPTFSPQPITAKVDTGAQTSSLHASELTLLEHDGATLAQFQFHPDPELPDSPDVVTSPVVDFRTIRSSNGQAETRPVIRTEVEIGEDRFEIDLTLTCRRRMGFRMLIGRRVLEDRYWVDPAQSFLLTTP